MGNQLCHFFRSYPVLLRIGNVGFHGAVEDPFRHKHRHSNHAAVTEGKFIFSGPNLAKEYIIVQLDVYKRQAEG